MSTTTKRKRSTTKKRAAAAGGKRRKRSAAKRGAFSIKVQVPGAVSLYGPDLGSLTASQRLELAAAGSKRSSSAPAWSDAALWRKAARLVSPHWKRYEHPHAAVAYVYLRLGGTVGPDAHGHTGRAYAHGHGRALPQGVTHDADGGKRRRLVRNAPGVHVERVELDELGYADDGKYYGAGEPLWRVVSDDPYFDQVVRARSAAAARSLMLERHSN